MIEPATLKRQVYFRLTDNWVELTVRFHEIRVVKDRMSREIINNLDAKKIGIASGTYEIVGLPPIRVKIDGREVEGMALLIVSAF